MKNKKDEPIIEFAYTDDECGDEDCDDDELEIANKNYEGVEIIESVVDDEFIDLMINALKELKKSKASIEIDLDEDTTLRLHHEENVDTSEEDIEEEDSE